MDEGESHVLASLRLLPTTGSHMLSDIFPQLVSNNYVIRSRTIWEASRFCIDHELHKTRSPNHVAIATAELLCAVGEIGLLSGLTHFVAATDIVIERILRHMGCPGERLGETKLIGKTMCVALAGKINEAAINTVKSIAHITGNTPSLRLSRSIFRICKRKPARALLGRV